MILCVDAGNTRIKWGLAADVRRGFGEWASTGGLALAEAAQLAQSLPEVRAAVAVVANVAGGAVREHIAAALRERAASVEWVAGRARQCGVTNRYADPAQLGADRWAALIAARSLHAGASLVVSAGTATTIDALDADGVFRGGLILPGLRMMRQALRRDTAQLAETEGAFDPFPRNTADAITSGAIQAHLGAVDRMRRALGPGALCLLGGGAAPLLHELLDAPKRRVDKLALEGLALIGRSLIDSGA